MSLRRSPSPRQATPSALPIGRIDPVPQSFWVVEQPTLVQSWADPDVVQISGWIGSPAPITDVGFVDPRLDEVFGLRLVERPDVVAVYPGLTALGFAASGRIADAGPANVIELRYTSAGDTQTIAIPARDIAVPPAERRHAKHQRIAPLLRCPVCAAESKLRQTARGTMCSRCGNDYPHENAFDMLPPALRDEFSVIATDNVSSNSYDGVSLNIINRLQSGLVLDCGSGNQSTYHPNVVNLEIAAYPSTDVLAVGERLPFVDDSFDAVLSFAVLEHVKQPAACAAEIMRVLKPGGTLYCQVPFLQPIHAYPNHFFNMTSQGLASLFEDLDVQHCASFPFGQPIFALSWMLGSYAAALPSDVRSRFEQMTVAELMQTPNHSLAADFVTQLEPAARDVLSCCNYLLAVKPKG